MGLEIRPKGLTETHLKLANIPQDYYTVDFGNYVGPEKGARLTKKYLKNLAEMNERGVGIMYAGPPGPGKTTLAMIAMKYLTRAGWTVFATSLGEIVENIQKSWGTGDAYAEVEDFIGRARKAHFLFIDDVGKEHRGGSGFVQTVFDNLIRYRVQHRLPTFLTTNLTKGELERIYGDSLASLLEGKVLTITIEGDDVRRTVLREQNRKAMRDARR